MGKNLHCSVLISLLVYLMVLPAFSRQAPGKFPVHRIPSHLPVTISTTSPRIIHNTIPSDMAVTPAVGDTFGMTIYDNYPTIPPQMLTATQEGVHFVFPEKKFW